MAASGGRRHDDGRARVALGRDGWANANSLAASARGWATPRICPPVAQSRRICRGSSPHQRRRSPTKIAVVPACGGRGHRDDNCRPWVRSGIFVRRERSGLGGPGSRPLPFRGRASVKVAGGSSDAGRGGRRKGAAAFARPAKAGSGLQPESCEACRHREPAWPSPRYPFGKSPTGLASVRGHASPVEPRRAVEWVRSGSRLTLPRLQPASFDFG